MKKMDSFNPGKSSSGCSWQKVQRIISLGCALGIMTLGSTIELRAENNTAKNSSNELAVAQANDGRVSGTVKDQNGEPLPGAVIRVKGTQIVTATDADGKYALAKLPNGAELVVSSVGMATQTVPVGSQSKIDITLQDQSTGLDEVVVTALGIKRDAKALGYAISSISAADIVKTGTPNFATALYGKMAGVRIQAAPGGSTSAVSLTVRGISSLSGSSQPLIILNGVPIRNGDANNKGYWDDQRINSNGLVDINPEDIENISVLKGAAATTLYGSEGANGVVMITTKSGKAAQGIGVDFSANISGDWVAYMPKYQTTFGPGVRVGQREGYEQATGGFWERNYNGQTYKSIRTATATYGPKYDGSDILYYDGTVRKYQAMSADPWNQIFRTGFNQTYNLGITQGNEKGNTRFSYTYANNLPTQYNSSYNKHNFNLSGTYTPNKNLKLDYSVNYILQDIKNRPYRISRLTNNFSGMFNAWDDVAWLREHTVTSLGYLNVTQNEKSLTPKESFAYDLATSSLISEYFWNIFGKEQLESSNRLLASLAPSWKIMDGLTLQGRISTDYTGQRKENKNKTEKPLVYGDYTGQYALQNSNYQIVYGDILLMYNKNLTEKLGLVANIGWQGRTEDYYMSYVSTDGGLANENWFNLKASYKTPKTDMSETHFLKDAYLATASLSWDNYLFLDLSGRREASSSLAGGKALYYGSVSSSFIYSDAFKDKLPSWYNYGKFRISYGKVGNAPALYWAQEAFNQGTASGYIYNTTQQSLGNDKIRPENKYEFELGLENKFFNNRLGLEVTYYNNKTVDEIIKQTLANPSGASAKLLNVGVVRNTGLELSLYGTPIQTKDWRWDLRGNIAFNRNKLTKLNDGSTVYIHPDSPYDGGAFSIESHVGQAMGDIYSYAPQTDENGNLIVGSDGFYKRTTERVKVGNVMPKATGGIGSTLAYKSFTLDLTLDFRIGGAVANVPYQYLMGRGSLANSMDHRDEAHGGLTYYFANNNGANMPTPGNGTTGIYTYDNGMILPGVKEDGSKNDIMIEADKYYNWTYNWGVDDPKQNYYSHSIFNNDYLKVREITLGYTLPKKLISKFSCKSMTVSAYARNPFYIHKNLPIFDAEATDGTYFWTQAVIGGSTATTRTFGMSLRMSF